MEKLIRFSKRIKGKLTSYNCLCKLFLRLQLFQLDPRFITHFYRVIQYGLNAGELLIDF